jgi:putative ABC transport system ATP-binding protein
LFADEPTGNLDSRTSLEVIGCFQELHKQGITVIIVTHETDIASYTDRIITFKDGKIKSDVINSSKRDSQTDLSNMPLEDEL